MENTHTSSPRVGANLLVGLLNIIFVVVVVFCISEVSSRISARNLLDEKIYGLQDGLAAEIESELSSQKAMTGSIRYRIDSYKSIKDDLSYLELAGANSYLQTISNIRRRINAISSSERISQINERLAAERAGVELKIQEVIARISENTTAIDEAERNISAEAAGATDASGMQGFGPRAKELQIQRDRLLAERGSLESRISQHQAEIARIDNSILASPDSGDSQDRDEPVTFNEFDWRILAQITAVMSNDMLIAISVILCGSIGAGVVFIRERRNDIIGSILIGVFSGFVTFLIVKGGRFFFLINAPSESIYLNPFALAFSGLLAGMFSDRAYSLLSDMVSTVADRVQTKPPALSDTPGDFHSKDRTGIVDKPDVGEPPAMMSRS